MHSTGQRFSTSMYLSDPHKRLLASSVKRHKSNENLITNPMQ
jgi:hypothetical protein